MKIRFIWYSFTYRRWRVTGGYESKSLDIAIRAAKGKDGKVTEDLYNRWRRIRCNTTNYD